MIWDFVVAYVAFTFGVAGYNVGAINSWRAAIAILFATLLTQLVYLDCSAWILEQFGLPADVSVFVGYAITWLFCCALVEALLFAVCPWQHRGKVRALNKLGGALIWLGKGFAMLLFATLAGMWSEDITVVPQRPALAAFIAQSSHRSLLLNGLRNLAVKLPARVVEKVVCVSPPAFEHDEPFTSAQADSPANTHVRQIMQNLRELQSEADGNL